MKVLVTGCQGFIGSNLVKFLLKKNYFVINIDKLSYSANPYNLKEINKNKNCVIGFGITGKTISNLKFADGLVVGSAICKEISKSSTKRQNPVTNVSNMVKNLRRKLL